MKQHQTEESSLGARTEFAIQWMEQRGTEWLESLHAEEKYREWLLDLINQNGYTLPELQLLRRSVRFTLALDYIFAGAGTIRRKLKSVLNKPEYKRDDHIEQEVIERNCCRHSHLLLSILGEANTKEKVTHPNKRRIH